MIRKRLPLAILIAASFGAPAFADPREADAILSEYQAVTMPAFDSSKRQDQTYVQEYRTSRAETAQKLCDLAKEFHDAYPEHEKAVELMGARWQNMLYELRKGNEVAIETMEYIEGGGALGAEAAYWNASADMMARTKPWQEILAGAERFIAMAPADARGGQMLSQLAGLPGIDQETKVGLYRRILASYPGAKGTAYIAGKIRQIDEFEKPLELEFQEAITGETISIENLRGKIVVMDFWATWCGPCVAEMPHMKELYAQFKDKGVEFIGVSLDQPEDKGGLTALKDYVAKNEIPWPQYYQGNYWQSEFSTSWGVNSIPCLFVLDHEGRLVSVDARGNLEVLLPELISKRDGA